MNDARKWRVVRRVAAALFVVHLVAALTLDFPLSALVMVQWLLVVPCISIGYDLGRRSRRARR